MSFAAFRDFEHEFWNKTSTPYDNGFGSVTSQAIPYLFDHLNIEDGQSLLDIACGPGYVSAAGRERNLLVTGVAVSYTHLTLPTKA